MNAMLRRQAQATEVRRDGFTLVELLAVIVLLTLAALVIAPGLAAVKPATKSVQCMNNLRQITVAWTMYATEHSDQVVNNYAIPGVQSEVAKQTYQTWANDVMDWTSAPMNTNRFLLTVGPLAPYLNGRTSVFQCPADANLSLVQKKLGWSGRVRSISMNGLFGRFSPGLSGDSTAVGQNPILSGYAQYLKLTRVYRPAKTWVMLDEHPDSINDPWFIVSPNANSWGDIPASSHDGGCGFGFADGHSEIRQWLSVTSKLPVRFNYFQVSFDAAGRIDSQWFLERSGLVNASTGRPAYGY